TTEASVVSASPGPPCRNTCRPDLVWVQEGTMRCRCNGAVSYGACKQHQTTMATGRGHQILLRQKQSYLVTEPHLDGQNHPQPMAASRIHGQIRPLPDGRWNAARWYHYTSYKVANMPIEFSTSIPRTQL